MDQACYRFRPAFPQLPAVGPVSLIIRDQEFVSLVGPDSCGSNTLIRMIAGITPLTSGEIRVHDMSVRTPLRDAGLAFSRPLLLAWRTVLGNVLLAAELRRLNPEESAARAKRLLAAVGLANASDQKPYALPPSDRQRVAICRALVHDPGLLLMDDPMHGMDALVLEDFAADIQRLWLARPVTTVLATSQISEAVVLSDRICVMSAAPCRLLQDIPVDLPRPRRLDKETTPRHADYCSRIRTLFQAHGILS